MASTDPASPVPGWRWAYRHPVLVGLAVFGVLYVPIALHGAIVRDWDDLVLPLPGALLLGGIFFSLYRWGATPGTRPPVADTLDEDVPSDAERNLAQVAQLGVLIVPAVAPAIVLLVGRDKPFVRRYAVQALFLQLLLAAAFVLLVLTVLGTDHRSAGRTGVQLLCGAVYVWCLAVSLMGTIKASNGIAWRYPFAPGRIR